MGKRVDLDDLVDPSEVAAIVGLENTNGVSVYQRRYPSFPLPVIAKGRCRLWIRADVETWARDNPRDGRRPR